MTGFRSRDRTRADVPSDALREPEPAAAQWDPEPIRVLVADDDPLITDGWAAVLGAAGGIEVAGTAADGAQALAAIARRPPDVALLFPSALRRVASRHVRPEPGGGGRRLALPASVPDGPPLTDRESEVLRLLARGLTNAEIAEELTVGRETVKTHVGNLLGKLGARDRTHAVVLAYELGYVFPGLG